MGLFFKIPSLKKISATALHLISRLKIADKFWITDILNIVLESRYVYVSKIKK